MVFDAPTRMRRLLSVAALAGLGWSLLSVPASAAGPTWSPVTELVGASTVIDGTATTQSSYLSCWTPGNCAEAGYYDDHNAKELAFLDTEVGGTWATAENVAGVTAGAVTDEVHGLSCGSAGNCLAIGTYTTKAEEDTFLQVGTPFLEQEDGGVWEPATDVPGLGGLDPSHFDYLDAVSCSGPGDCAVAGTYYVKGTFAAFVASERNGTWSKAAPLAGQAAMGLSRTGLLEAPVEALSCSSVGNCILGGELFNGASKSRGYLAEEAGGTWGAAKLVPGLARLDADEGGETTAVSCSSVGNCTVGGTYLDGTRAPQAFIASQADGKWSNAIEVPGTAALNSGGGQSDEYGDIFGASVQTILCSTNGNCTSVGWFETSGGASDLFVDSEVSGKWDTASAMPGLAALNAGASINNDGAAAAGLSCPSAGNCVIAGNYVDEAGASQIFTETEQAGIFGQATELPGSASLDDPYSADPYADTVNTLDCTDLADCSLAGVSALGGFDALQAGGSWSDPNVVITSPTVFVGTNGEVTDVSCPTTGGCEAFGGYEAGDGSQHGFYAQETGGVWGHDEETGPPPTSIYFRSSFTCSSIGNCQLVASDITADALTLTTTEEVGGTWQSPVVVPGFPAPTKGSSTELLGPRLSDIDCSSASSCVGVGYDVTGQSADAPFIATESNGDWAVTLDPPGTSKLPGTAQLTNVACSSAGNCTVLGDELPTTGTPEEFALTETHGVWGQADLLTSVIALSTAKGASKFAFIDNLDCPAAGTCVATGSAQLAGQTSRPFVMSETHGKWGKARYVPGFATLARIVPSAGRSNIDFVGLGCAGAETCTAAGVYPPDYDNDSSVDATFVVSEHDGTWSNLRLVANPKATVKGRTRTAYDFSAAGVACPSAASCSLVGILEETAATKSGPDTDFTQLDAMAYSNGADGSFSAPVPASKALPNNDVFLDPFEIDVVECGPAPVCAIGGSESNEVSTTPFVMTTG